MSKKYLVKNGLDYDVDGEPRRAEPDDVVDDLPPKSVSWLLDRGHIEEYAEPEPAKTAAPKKTAAKTAQKPEGD